MSWTNSGRDGAILEKWFLAKRGEIIAGTGVMVVFFGAFRRRSSGDGGQGRIGGVGRTAPGNQPRRDNPRGIWRTLTT